VNQPQTQTQSAGDKVSGAEKHAREHLAAGRFRKARDVYKDLCKIDRAKYLPGLIEANLGLANDMAAKGQVSEAQQVLAYLRTIAPPAQLQAMEFELARKGQRWADLLRASVPALADAGDALSPAQKLLMADTAVVAFLPIPAATPAQAQLAAHIGFVHAGLEAIAQGQFERALELVRPLPSGSAFAPWKLFIKGLAAFHTGDREKAAQFFAALPQDSVAAKAAQPYLLLAGKLDTASPRHQLTDSTIQVLCQLAGQPALGRLLARAEQLWREQNYKAAYKLFRDSMPDYPSERTDLPGVLSEFFFNAPLRMSEHRSDAYLEYFSSLAQHQHTKNLLELKMIYRVLALDSERYGEAFDLKVYWVGFLQAEEKLHGPNPRLASLVYGQLGQDLAEADEPPLPFSDEKPRLLDPEGAVEYLNKSIDLDPANLEAHLKLVEVYEKLDRSSERIHLLDLMADRFPDRKEVLLQAGRGCLDRGAFIKGLAYVERAFEFDRLDPQIPDTLALGYFNLAAQYYSQRRFEDARQTLDRLEPLSIEQPLNLLRNRWAFLTRRGLLETLVGEKALGQSFLQAGDAASPFHTAFLFYTHLGHCVCTRKKVESPFEHEVTKAMKDAPTAARATVLLHIRHFWGAVKDPPPLGNEDKLLRNYLRAAAKQPFTRDEALQLMEAVKWVPGFQEAASAFVDKILAADPLDPRFRLYKLLITKQDDPFIPAFRQELDAIAAEAARRHDDPTAQLAKTLRATMPRDLPPLPDEPDYGPAPDEDFPDDSPDFGGFFSPKDAPVLREIMDVLATASDAELRRLRKSMTKKIPGHVFDMMVEASRSGNLPPLPPLPPPGPGPSFNPTSPKFYEPF
jgi:tetratricopeptide (TPR) repeat protein